MVVLQFYLTNVGVDIVEDHDWDPEAHLPHWEYLHHPKKPKVGSNGLMHLWQNPDHANPELFLARRSCTDVVIFQYHRLSRYMSNFVSPKVISEMPGANSALELEQEGPETATNWMADNPNPH